jgi:creatinine amidohydrolase
VNWENLTAPEFKKGIKKCDGVCLLPFGVIEKHGDHLPLGQDSLYIHKFCTEAADIEPAMVFPSYYFGQICEAQHVPGTIALHHELLIPLLENVCDEIARNGFKKIIIVNGHGGNIGLLQYFTSLFMDKKKDYIVFHTFPFNREQEKTIQKAEVDGHGGECETSCALHYFPELVKSDTPANYGLPLKRYKKYDELDLNSGIWWYAEYPEHFAADTTKGSARKGEKLVELRLKHLVKQVKLVKEDNSPFELYTEFFERISKE